MLQTVLPDVIRETIENKNWTRLVAPDIDWPEYEIIAPELADYMREIDKTDRVLLFRALPRDLKVDIFAFLDPETSDNLLLELTNAETRHILAELEPDDRTVLLGELPGQVTQRLLMLLSPDDLKEARQLLGYPEESIGRLMTPDYVAVRPSWTLAEALDHIRRHGNESETVNTVYVTDKSGNLLDALPLRRFILSKTDETVESIMDDTVVSISAYDDREEAVRVMQRYDRSALPVVDSSGVLLGIVTFDDMFEVAEQEATEDFHRSAAISPLKGSYWEISATRLFRSRIGWLSILVFVNLISSGVISAFEGTLAAYVSLAFFIPLIIGTGGNTGAQSATLMIRSISTGDIRLNQWGRVFMKELLIGAAIGLSLGALGAVLGLFRGGPAIGLVVFMTMSTMLIMTNLMGMFIPFVLTKVNLDPAIASGPLITSIADAVGLVIYFSYAHSILGL
ncbi:MAG: magnesium transporter [Spirochaetia bacterium]